MDSNKILSSNILKSMNLYMAVTGYIIFHYDSKVWRYALLNHNTGLHNLSLYHLSSEDNQYHDHGSNSINIYIQRSINTRITLCWQCFISSYLQHIVFINRWHWSITRWSTGRSLCICEFIRLYFNSPTKCCTMFHYYQVNRIIFYNNCLEPWSNWSQYKSLHRCMTILHDILLHL